MVIKKWTWYKAPIKVYQNKQIIFESKDFSEILNFIQDKRNSFDYVTIDNKDFIYSKEVQRKKIEALITPIFKMKDTIAKKGINNVKPKSSKDNISLEDLYLYALRLERIEREQYRREYPTASNFIAFFEDLKRIRTFTGLNQKFLDIANTIILGLWYWRDGDPKEVIDYIDLFYNALIRNIKKYKFIYLYLQPFKEVLYELNKYANNLIESWDKTKIRIWKKTQGLLKEWKDYYLHYAESYPLWGLPEYFDYDRTLIGNLKADIKSIAKKYWKEIWFSADDFYIKLWEKLVGRNWLNDLTRYDF